MSYFGVGAVKRSFPPLRFPVGTRVHLTSGPPVTNTPQASHGIIRHQKSSREQEQQQRWYMGTVVQQWCRDTSFTGYFAPYLVELDPIEHNNHAPGENRMILVSFDSDLWIRSPQKLEQNLKRKRIILNRRFRSQGDEPAGGCFMIWWWSSLFSCARDPMVAIHQNTLHNNTSNAATSGQLLMDKVWKAKTAFVVVNAFSEMLSLTQDDSDKNGNTDIDRIRVANMVAILLHAGGIPIVLKAMKQHVNNAVVQATACSFLTTIGRRNHGNMEAVFKADGVTHILNAMQAHSDSKPVQQAALQALSQLAWLDGGERAILKAKGVPILMASIRRNLRHVEILKDGCGVLLYLSIRRENRAFILQNGGRMAAIVALGEHPNDPNLEKVVRALLKNLNMAEDPTLGLIPKPPQRPPMFRRKKGKRIGIASRIARMKS
jgi:hypothetical protein